MRNKVSAMTDTHPSQRADEHARAHDCERIIWHADSTQALQPAAPAHAHLAARRVSVVVSLPDVSETGQSLPAWQQFFVDAAALCAASTSPDGLFIALQSDIRVDGWWVDKSALVLRGLERTSLRLVARKVLCRKPPGTSSSSRASFSHALVFAHRPLQLPDILPDVIVATGEPTWKRGMGAHTTLRMLEFVRRHAPACDSILDPFCGEGLVLAQAQQMGFHAYGIERHHKRAQTAQRMRVNSDGLPL
jgi:hypothetical protein